MARQGEKELAMKLGREDLLAMERKLCACLGRFLTFSAHNVFFPPSAESLEPELLAAEKRLLLPLARDGEFLGMLMLSGIRLKQARALFPHLPAILSLCLDNLALAKAAAIDAFSGLPDEAHFYALLESEAALARSHLEDPGRSGQAPSLSRMCLGMIVVSWPEAPEIAEKLDDSFCWGAMGKMAETLKQILSADVAASILGLYEGRFEFGLLFHAAGRASCRKLAQKAIGQLGALCFRDELSGIEIRPRLCAGHALYPQDMRGSEMRLPMLKQALLLRNRARLASQFALESPDGLMAYKDILPLGGKVLRDLGQGRLLINLGRSAKARVGMLFQVVEEARPKGQIVLLEPGENESIAEIMYVDEAGNMPQPGDRLALILQSAPGRHLVSPELAGEAGEISLSNRETGLSLWSHAEFLAALDETSGKYARFTLGIARLEAQKDQPDSNFEDFFLDLEQFLESLTEKMDANRPLLAGRYGRGNLIFFHGDANGEDAAKFYHYLRDLAGKSGISLAAGLFAYPFLDFAKSESEACALKALEYARLLPEPKIGIFDSLALNISADKKYSLGDVFGAMEEFQLALLADPANAMARNSLGVCMADLGKREKAVKLFNEALEHANDAALRAKIYYNLGVVFEKRGEADTAGEYYGECLKLAPEHVYAWLRLGQVMEKCGREKQARSHYEKASSLAGDDANLKNLADRHIARLDGGGKSRGARELLHDALLRDPEDASTLLMLAKSYFGEDLEMAEMFARKSAEISGRPEAWKLLAEILVERGKKEEARQARSRAEKKQNLQ